jgi:hypothetical protein
MTIPNIVKGNSENFAAGVSTKSGSEMAVVQKEAQPVELGLFF